MWQMTRAPPPQAPSIGNLLLWTHIPLLQTASGRQEEVRRLLIVFRIRLRVFTRAEFQNRQSLLLNYTVYSSEPKRQNSPALWSLYSSWGKRQNKNKTHKWIRWHSVLWRITTLGIDSMVFDKEQIFASRKRTPLWEVTLQIIIFPCRWHLIPGYSHWLPEYFCRTSQTLRCLRITWGSYSNEGSHSVGLGGRPGFGI